MKSGYSKRNSTIYMIQENLLHNQTHTLCIVPIAICIGICTDRYTHKSD